MNPCRKWGSLSFFACCACWLTIHPWRWRYVLPKRRLSFNGLHDVTSQKMNVNYAFLFFFFKIFFNIILSSTLRFSEMFPSFRVFLTTPFQCIYFLFHATTCSPSHFSWGDYSNNTRRGMQLWNSTLCSFLHPSVTPPSSVHIFSSAPWSQIPFDLCSYHNARTNFQK
jgi:hypothetical protein